MFSTRNRNYEGILAASHHDLLNSNTAPKFAMGDAFGAMNKVQSHDDETQGSGSGSGFSDWSALENETDEFGRRLLQHQRDARRLNALRGNQQAFRKARPRLRVAEMLEREERESGPQSGENHDRPGSEVSNDPEPPVTVPREWGRKARKQTDWMRKILEPSEPSENGDETLKHDEEAVYPHTTAYTGDAEWRDAVNEPINPFTDTPPTVRRQPVMTPPSSLRHMNTTLKPNTNSEDGDFSAASLLASTPARTRLPRKIDELTRREIESVQRQAVTTRTLDEIDQQSPNGTLRRTSSSRLRERAIADGMTSNTPPCLSRPTTSLGHSAGTSKIPRRQGSFLGLKENVPPSGQGHGDDSVTKIPRAVGLENRTQAVNIRTSQRPGHQRNDSMGLLRKLARVSGMSPSPASDQRRDMDGDAKEAEPPRGDELLRTTKNDYVTDSQPPSKDMGEGHWGFVALQSEQLDNEGAPRLNDPAAGYVDETPMPRGQAQDAKTPVVTGAWVDTTLHHEGDAEVNRAELNGEERAPDSVSSSHMRIAATEETPEEEILRRIKSEPAHPKSALDALLREDKDLQQGQLFGESTIQSLEDIVNPNVDPTDTTITFDFAAANVADENLDNALPLTQDEKDRRQEGLAIEALNKHLRSARTSIKDANRGLRRVENKIENVDEAAQTTRPTNAVAATPKSTAGSGYIHCDVCGGGYRSVWYALYTEFRSCFYTWDPNYKYRLRLTALGATCLIWFIWYIVENIMCYQLCYPLYTSKTRFRLPDPDNDPIYPFVIPTMLFRPLRPLWKPAYNIVANWLEATFHDFLVDINTPPGVQFRELPKGVKVKTVRKVFEGMPTPSSKEWEWLASGAMATGARVARSVVDAVDEVGSMWDDEFVS